MGKLAYLAGRQIKVGHHSFAQSFGTWCLPSCMQSLFRRWHSKARCDFSDHLNF